MMRAFFRTVWGKMILVIVCIASILTAAACAYGASITVSAKDGYVYLRTEAQARKATMENSLREDAAQCLYLVLTKQQDSIDVRNLNYVVLSPSLAVLYQNALYRGQIFYRFKFVVKYDLAAGYRIMPLEDAENYKSEEVYTVNEEIRSVDSAYSIQNTWIHTACSLDWWILAVGFAALALAVISFIALMRVSARRPKREELVPGLLHKVPYDLMLAAGVAAVLALGFFMRWLLPIDYSGELRMYIGAAAIGLLILIGLSVSAAARIKTKTLLSNTLTARILKLLAAPFLWLFGFLKKLVQNLPLIWKTALALAVLALLEFFVILAQPHVNAAEFWLDLVKWLILIPAVLYLALCLRRLQKGGEALAAGDLTYQTDTKDLPVDLKKHAENLNSIGEGMGIAVKEQLKSERMKTELITNVSHDLKTPLTSVINYADLIGKESCDNPKITEYSEVLLRQSERLKRLIDDLVEASKASSGDLDVNLVPCDAAVFLQQAAGEYEEKLQQANLKLVIRQPEEEIRIKADGRRMWRIFDNLMNNIVKYAQSGTRAYLTLERSGNEAVITFRNTSREPLDAVNAEELTERFTRGDASRNTEGSGLGLAIAKSLTELQGGNFAVAVDGDLFKVMIRFPVI